MALLPPGSQQSIFVAIREITSRLRVDVVPFDLVIFIFRAFCTPLDAIQRIALGFAGYLCSVFFNVSSSPIYRLGNKLGIFILSQLVLLLMLLVANLANLFGVSRILHLRLRWPFKFACHICAIQGSS